MKTISIIIIFGIVSCSVPKNDFSPKEYQPLSRLESFRYLQNLIKDGEYDLIARKFCKIPLAVKGPFDENPTLEIKNIDEIVQYLRFYFESSIYTESEQGLEKSTNRSAIASYEVKNNKLDEGNGIRFNDVIFELKNGEKYYIITTIYLDDINN